VVQDLVVPAVPLLPVARAHTIRPYCARTDEQAVYDVCRRTCDDGADGTDIFPFHKDLVADKFIGAYLQYSPEYSFVIEDAVGICGYVLAALDAKEHAEKVENEWIPAMQEKYPKPNKSAGELSPAEEMICSLHNHKSYVTESVLTIYPSIIHMDILPERCDGVAMHALASAVAALKTNGSHGIYAQMHVGDRNTVERYSRLNMLELAHNTDQPEDLVLVARTI
jgi:protein O-GlcNAcase/histone acetyltransferase